MSGYLNVIPIQSGLTYSISPPSIDFGSDGDYTLDLNSNILYGPKNSSSSQPWPIGPTLSTSFIWLGSWTGWFPPTSSSISSFTTGQVVDDGTGQYYVCIKPHSIVYNDVGPWTAGQYYRTGSGGSTLYYLCLQDTATDPTLDPTNWLSGDAAGLLYADSQQFAGVGGNWQAFSDTITINNKKIDGVTTLDLGQKTNLIVKDASITAKQLADSSVSNAKLLKTAGSEAVSTGAIRDNAVTTAKIADTNVTFAKLASAAIASSSDTSSSKLVVASDSRLSDARTPNYSYNYVNTNPLFLSYYQIPANQTFVELADGLGITEIRLPSTAPNQGLVIGIRNASSVDISIKNNLSAGTIFYAGGSGSSFTLASGATALLVYTGFNNFVRTTAYDGSQITSGTINSSRLPSSVVFNSSPTINTPTIDSGATGTTTFKAGTQTAFTIANFASNTAPLINFGTNAQLVNTIFNNNGVKFNGTSGFTTVVAATNASGTVTLPTSSGTIALTSDNITGTAAGVSSGSIAATGNIDLPYRSISSAYTIGTTNSTDYTIDCTANTFTVTLPSATTVGAGRTYNIKNSGTGTITIATTSSQTIDGASTITMNGSVKQYQTITVQSTGSNWIII